MNSRNVHGLHKQEVKYRKVTRKGMSGKCLTLLFGIHACLAHNAGNMNSPSELFVL